MVKDVMNVNLKIEKVVNNIKVGFLNNSIVGVFLLIKLVLGKLKNNIIE